MAPFSSCVSVLPRGIRRQPCRAVDGLGHHVARLGQDYVEEGVEGGLSLTMSKRAIGVSRPSYRATGTRLPGSGHPSCDHPRPATRSLRVFMWIPPISCGGGPRPSGDAVPAQASPARRADRRGRRTRHSPPRCWSRSDPNIPRARCGSGPAEPTAGHRSHPGSHRSPRAFAHGAEA